MSSPDRPKEVEVAGKDGARNFVESMAELVKEHTPARNFYEWVLKNGRSYELEKFDAEQTRLINKMWSDTRPQLKECFYNALKVIAFANPRFEYVEGWGVSYIPCDHAWNLLDGKVVDLTWNLRTKRASREFKSGSIRLGESYFGVVIPRQFVYQRTLERGLCTPSLAAYYEAQTGIQVGGKP